MSKRFFAILAILTMLAAPLAAQSGLATVAGKCTDDDGKPILGAVVKFLGTETGLKYEYKVDKKGEFRTIAMQPGLYKITLVGADGTELYFFNNKRISLSVEVNQIDFDMKDLHSGKGDGKPTVDPKVLAEALKQQEKVKKENAAIGALNDLLSQAGTAQAAGNFDQAIDLMKKATEAGPTYDIVWYRLGETYRAAAKQDKDQQKWVESAKAYQKAIEIASAPGAPDRAKNALGDYYNNMAEAYAQSNQMPEATAAYEKAATLDPAQAGRYYFNLGAHLTNRGQIDAALVAFDKAIAADPAKAEAYYQRGVTLLQKATFGKDGKIVAAPGTSEAFNKYLELEPEGRFSKEAKDMLAYIGSKVETTYVKKKK